MSGFGPRVRSTYDNGAPVNYVAGLGRGAVGFTTRSDIGPARPSATPYDQQQPPPGYVAGGGRGLGDQRSETRKAGFGRGSGTAGAGGFGREEEHDEVERDYSESNYDEFSGYGGSLFSDTPYEDDDREADAIYDSIDRKMDERRKRRREEIMREQMKKIRQERPKISEQFADLKQQLGSVSQSEWEAIPDIGDYSLKHKQSQRRAEIYTPMPDHIINSARQTGSTTGLLDPRQQRFGGIETPAAGTTSMISGLAEARGTVLSLKLDRMSDSVAGQTVVDPKGYLTDLNSLKITSDAEIGDIKKARALFKSVTSTNPKHAPGWIAAARLEETTGRIVQARLIIKQGCEMCPESEDVWLEAAHLNTPENAKMILREAVRHVPTSVKVWMQATELESDENAKKRVLRKALEFVPNSIRLWKAAIELEEEEDAKIMLSRGVECVPQSVEMWLALARLETYENAKQVLTKAREANPTEPAIWIAAAKLQEANNEANVDQIIQRAILTLKQQEVVIDREQWLKEAEAAEHDGAPQTAGAIVRAVIEIGVEVEDRKRTWTDDAESALTRNSPETARAIYAHALTVFPTKKSIWLQAAALEKKHGTRQSLDEMLRRAVNFCPTAEILWLMAAKEAWMSQDVPQARQILKEAFGANQNSEQIWLAAVKLEWESGETERAEKLLARARDNAKTERVWLKSIILQTELAVLQQDPVHEEEEKRLLLEAISLFPTYPKFYMMAGQREERLGNDKIAKDFYQQGLRRCPQSIPLWTLALKLEERMSGVTKARSVFELSRINNPQCAALWLEAIRLEHRHGNAKLGEQLLARALQECPNSGLLWAESIMTAPRPAQKSKSYDALKRCDQDPHVIVAVGRLFWNERKHPKARKWFNRAVTLDPDNGDAWAYYYWLELSHGNAEDQEEVSNRCSSADPHHGEIWCSISKKTENRHCDTRTILKKVVAQLQAASKATALATA